MKHDLTLKTLYRTAYSAARAAMHTDEPGYRSPLAAALDATLGYRDFPGRFHAVHAATRAAEMHGSFRRRLAMRVMLRPATSMKLAGLRLRLTEVK
jgi:hypothetical protein